MSVHHHRRTDTRRLFISTSSAAAGPARAAWRAALALLLCASVSSAAEPGSANLADLSIEQLMNESVTSVSKKETTLDESPAAISVITNDDIRRLGITSIPEALRLAPGLDVARVGASQWAISSRGFNSEYANKLLVLVDGRSVYTPSFGGVYWDAQDMILDDLDRIEVIRGPGATLWGANAVNGVINISSKNSKDTQGFLTSDSFGTEDQPSVSVRYGGALGSDLHYRAYVKYFNRDGLEDAQGDDANDAWDSLRGGFRADWEPSKEDLVTLQGDYYALHTGGELTVPRLVPPYTTDLAENDSSDGGNVLGRWTHTFSAESQLTIQSYFDHLYEEHSLGAENRDTFDLELVDRFPLGSWNDVMTGIDYRRSADQYTNSTFLAFNPTRFALHLYSAFVQDEITLAPRQLFLTIGCKAEHNDYTGWEAAPSIRLQWTPTKAQTLWASVSRAVSTPTRVARTGSIATLAFPTPSGLAGEVSVLGNANVVSETLAAYEAGYRVEPARNLSLDIAIFYNRYDKLTAGGASGAPQFEAAPTPHLSIPAFYDNNGSGATYGLEASVQWKPTERWRLTANYSWLHTDLQGSGLLSNTGPVHQASLRSYVTLPWNLEFNSFLSYVDRADAFALDGSIVSIPAYVRADAGIVWHPRDSLEVGFWGQNLLDSRHREFVNPTSAVNEEIPRSFIGKVTWRY